MNFNFNMTKHDWNYQFGYVEGYLGAMGYSLDVSSDKIDRVDLQTRTVHINKHYSPENRFYTLLHELGHIVIYEYGIEEFRSEYPLYVSSNDKRTWLSHAGRISVVGEEYEAWHIGRRFANTENLKINASKFNKLMTKQLLTYIKWAAR